LIFGSQELVSNSKESDIDSICVVPKFVEREKHFFGIFFETLKAEKFVT